MSRNTRSGAAQAARSCDVYTSRGPSTPPTSNKSGAAQAARSGINRSGAAQAARSIRAHILALPMLFLSCFHFTPAAAQEIRMGVQAGPYYVNDPMVVQIQITGVSANQAVDCRYIGDLPGEINIAGPQVSQSNQSFTQIINGKVTRNESINYLYNFTVTSTREGSFTIGPFEIQVDGEQRELEGPEIEFGRLEDDPDMALEVTLETNPIYVGQRVPVKIRWAFTGDSLQYAYQNLQIRSPLFDQFDFVDSAGTSRTTLSISTSQGIVEIDATVSKENRDGREYVVVTGERILAADRAGSYEAIPVTCRTQRVTSWGRDFFGDRRPRAAKPAIAAATPLSFKILPLPAQGRPASFSGAVGNGFSIEVTANRSVVRVGDPITLRITVRGDGNLENVALPGLSAGLPSDSFQVPNESPSGQFNGNSKTFEVSVRVKSAAVDQLPAIPFAWFDPDAGEYRIAQSKPVALQVEDAQIVSAADVVSAAAADSAAGRQGEQSASRQANGTGLAQTSVNFMGANLAIERDPARLLAVTGAGWSQGWVIAAIYLSGVAAILVAWATRRAGTNRSATNQQLRDAVQAARQTFRKARNMPTAQAAECIAAALRSVISATPSTELKAKDRELADRVVAECDNLVYAPQPANDSARKAELLTEAQAALDHLVKK